MTQFWLSVIRIVVASVVSSYGVVFCLSIYHFDWLVKAITLAHSWHVHITTFCQLKPLYEDFIEGIKFQFRGFFKSTAMKYD